MVVYEIKAPRWDEKTPSFTSREMKTKGISNCRFCTLAEEPLVESSSNWRILKAKYPYIPQHCIITPKEHLLTLHNISKNQFDSMFTAIGKILQHFPGATALGNFGIVAGQTIRHLHIHLLCSKVEESKYLELKSAENLIADPLSVPILVESGHLTLCNGYDTAVTRKIHRNDLYDYIRSIIPQLFDGFFRLVQSRMYEQVVQYGYGYHNLERVAWLYGISTDNLNNIEFLLNTRVTSGIGVNWMISEYDKDMFKIHIIPRATSVSGTFGLERRIGGLELFHNTILSRTKLRPDIENEWKEAEKEFWSTLKKAARDL
ncbi:MAG: HIT family protein [Candidatus Micrarchaeia archaeon]